MASIINNSQKSCYKNKFKIAAVALAEKPGYSNRKAARELGIAESNIRMWKKVLPDILAAPRSKCITKSRRGAKWPNIEKRMRDYIDDKYEVTPCIQIPQQRLMIQGSLTVMKSHRISGMNYLTTQTMMMMIQTQKIELFV